MNYINPVYPVILSNKNGSWKKSAGNEINDLDIQEIDLGMQEALFDLSLRLEDLAEGLNCKLVYNEKLFTRESAQQFLAQFQMALSTAVDDPEIRLSKLGLLLNQSTIPDLLQVESTGLRESSDLPKPAIVYQ